MMKANKYPAYVDSLIDHNQWNRTLQFVHNESTIEVIINSINLQFTSLGDLLEAHFLQNKAAVAHMSGPDHDDNLFLPIHAQLSIAEQINTLQMVVFQKTNLYMDILHKEIGSALDVELQQYLNISQLQSFLMLKSDWILSLTKMIRLSHDINYSANDLLAYETILVKLALTITTIMTAFPEETYFFPVLYDLSPQVIKQRKNKKNTQLLEASTLLVQASHVCPFSSKKNKHSIYKTIDLLQREGTEEHASTVKVNWKQQKDVSTSQIEAAPPPSSLPIKQTQMNTTKPLVHYTAKPITIIKNSNKKH